MITMKKFKANEKVRFKIITTRKGDRFALSHEGQLTMIETATVQDVKNELVAQFLSEINRPYNGQIKYRPNDVKVTVCVA